MTDHHRCTRCGDKCADWNEDGECPACVDERRYFDEEE